MRWLSVLDILEETASRLPEKTYLKDRWGAISYADFRERARCFAAGLHDALGGATGRPVVLFIDKGIECVVAMLGTVYSGNFYVPMDVKTPHDRLEAILSTVAGAEVVSSARDAKALEKTGFEGEARSFEELVAAGAALEPEVRDADLAVIRSRLVDTDLMYVLFTSGSTGTPKGVCVSHRSVVDYVAAFQATVALSESDILGNQTPLYVDMSLKDIYMGMAAGATVCLIPQTFFMSPKKLLAYLDDEHVTTLMWVPTAYRLISQFDALELVRPHALTRLLFSGESMPIPVYRYWRANYPRATFIQQYGPTEITGACTNFFVERDYADDETVPIGQPFPNTGIILVAEDGTVLDPATSAKTGDTGEICVYGSCLAAGYYANPERTAEAFVAMPGTGAYPTRMYRTGDVARYDAEGNIVFVSRKDHQVKHGGRRIELGEVEHAFQGVEGVDAVCCVHDPEEDRLVLAYVGEREEREMARAVRERLPRYMIPTAYLKKDALPQLPSGKLDRKAVERWVREE